MSHKLNHQVIFEGLDKLDQEHRLLGPFVDKDRLYDHLVYVAEKSLEQEEDLSEATNRILKHWNPALYRYVNYAGTHFPWDLDLEVQDILVKAGYPPLEDIEGDE